MDLTDATALVTGANRGIGRALCEGLAARPLKLVLAGVRDPDAFEPIEGRAEVRPVRVDLSSRESIDACAASLPPLELLVNNASISGYAYFPAATTYAASKAGAVALSESLRRELNGTGVGVLHVVTPGVNTDMLDATEEVYGRHMDTSGWDKVEPDAWAEKVLTAVEAGDHIVGPGGRLAVAKLASRGPAFLVDAISSRMFSRRPRT